MALAAEAPENPQHTRRFLLLLISHHLHYSSEPICDCGLWKWLWGNVCTKRTYLGIMNYKIKWQNELKHEICHM